MFHLIPARPVAVLRRPHCPCAGQARSARESQGVITAQDALNQRFLSVCVRMSQPPGPLGGTIPRLPGDKLRPPTGVADLIINVLCWPHSLSCISSPPPCWGPRHLPCERLASIWLFWNHLGVISAGTGLPKNTPGIGTSVTPRDSGRTGAGLTHAAALMLTETFENSTPGTLILMPVTPGHHSTTFTWAGKCYIPRKIFHMGIDDWKLQI